MEQATKRSLAKATGIAFDSLVIGVYTCLTTLSGIALVGGGLQFEPSLASGAIAGATAALHHIMKKRKIQV